jgi:hypothetical protein
MIDITNYVKNKEKGVVSVAKVGSSFTYSRKRFDPDTGEALESEVEALDLPDLEKKSQALADSVIAIGVLIADLRNL